MKKIIHFIGIDVSKETLDIALIRNNDKSNIYSSKVTNNKTGFKKMKQWLKGENISLQEAVFCIEHTGMYSKPGRPIYSVAARKPMDGNVFKNNPQHGSSARQE